MLIRSNPYKLGIFIALLPLGALSIFACADVVSTGDAQKGENAAAAKPGEAASLPSSEAEDPPGDAGSSPPDAGKSQPDAGAKPEGPCPTAKAGESVYCEPFEGPAIPNVGSWTISGTPFRGGIGDAGWVDYEDPTQFWSAPNSRKTYFPLAAHSIDSQPVKELVMRFRFRPKDTPTESYSRSLGSASLGDAKVLLGWVDYGKFDATKVGSRGYAIYVFPYVQGSTAWAPIANPPTPNVWSEFRISLRPDTATVAINGALEATLMLSLAPSTSADFVFGSTSDSLNGNIDDVSAVVSH